MAVSDPENLASFRITQQPYPMLQSTASLLLPSPHRQSHGFRLYLIVFLLPINTIPNFTHMLSCTWQKLYRDKFVLHVEKQSSQPAETDTCEKETKLFCACVNCHGRVWADFINNSAILYFDKVINKKTYRWLANEYFFQLSQDFSTSGTVRFTCNWSDWWTFQGKQTASIPPFSIMDSAFTSAKDKLILPYKFKCIWELNTSCK